MLLAAPAAAQLTAWPLGRERAAARRCGRLPTRLADAICARRARRPARGGGAGVAAERLRDALAPLIKSSLPGRGHPPWRISTSCRARPRQASNLGHFVAELALDPPQSSSDLAGPPHLDEDYLVLSTIHSAKGLEWDAVHVLALYDGNFPACMSAGSSESIDEERRLLYVAMTRARRQLHLYVPVRYYHRPKGIDDAHGYGKASRFLTEEVQATCDVVRAADGLQALGAGLGGGREGRRIEVSVDGLFR